MNSVFSIYLLYSVFEVPTAFDIRYLYCNTYTENSEQHLNRSVAPPSRHSNALTMRHHKTKTDTKNNNMSLKRRMFFPQINGIQVIFLCDV